MDDADMRRSLEAARTLPHLSDPVFVDVVRNHEARNPQWRDYRVWSSVVRQEIDFRVLLRLS